LANVQINLAGLVDVGGSLPAIAFQEEAQGLTHSLGLDKIGDAAQGEGITPT
jgi:hypothetical protein